MEVDHNPLTTAQVDSRHTSPFVINLPASPSAVMSHVADRKRRRGAQSLSGPLSPSLDYGHQDDRGRETDMSDHESIDMAGGPAKRRHVDHSDYSTDNTHHYRSLGSAYGDHNHQFETEGAEYGVDSPMHFLSLASPSPPQLDGDDKISGNDIDMSDSSSSSSASRKPSSSFLPRQVKQQPQFVRKNSNSTIPHRPSPLIYSQRFQSSSSTAESSGRALSSSQNSSSEESSNKKIYPEVIQESHYESQSSSSTSSPRQASQYAHRSAESPLAIARTPSPSPITSTSGDFDARKLHHSPGLSQSSFPGGKQMLRYTMGYREDCSSCKSKTPGHYGHVMHR